MICMKSRLYRWLRLAALTLAGAFGLCRPTWAQTAEEPTFFYSGGGKHALTPSARWVGVELQVGANASDVEARLKQQAGVNAREPALRYPRHRLLVLAAEGNLARTARQALRARLEAQPGVRRAVRVFGNAKKPIVETDEFVIQFQPGVGRAEAGALLQPYGAILVRALGPHAPNGWLAQVQDPETNPATETANALHERPEVVFSHPNLIWPKAKRFVPNDPLFANQWHLNNTGQGGGTAGADVKAPAAWDITRGAATVTIAIIDDGLDTSHEDLQGGKIVAGYDFVNDDSDPRPGSLDYHGTACAGVATATGNNALGVSGVAPGCKLMPIRLIGDTATLQDEGDSFRWAADHGAAIISCSWGPEDGTGQAFPLPDVTKAGIDYAVANGRGGKGCVIFWAAGNGNESADLDGYASYSKVICVAASTNQDKHAYYSDYGASVDICAPSNGGTLGITTIDRTGSVGYSSGNYTSTFGGTSSATPLAAGVGALLLSADPSLTYLQVRQRLQDSADKIDPAGGAYNSSGHSTKYGYGRVNALRALQGLNVPTYAIGGRVTLNGAALANVKVTANPAGLTATTSSTGAYTISGVPASAVTVSPKLSGYVFTPASRSVTVGPNATGVDFTAQVAPTVTLLAPLDNATVSGSYPVRARTTADALVSRMVFARRSANVTFNRTVNRALADNSTITDTANVTGSGTVAAAAVSVNIRHTYIGDLVVTLIAPDGTRAVLHDQTGGDTDNLVKTYTNVAVKNKAIAGAWKLEVKDVATYDTGTLVSWGMTITPNWITIASDTNGPSAGEWTATWNTATTPPGFYQVRALAVTTGGNYTDVNSNITVAATTATSAATQTRTMAAQTLSVASATANSPFIELTFAFPLDAGTANDPQRYAVTVDDAPLAVERATCSGNRVTLRVERALPAGAVAQVSWWGLTDAQGQELPPGAAQVVVR